MMFNESYDDEDRTVTTTTTPETTTTTMSTITMPMVGNPNKQIVCHKTKRESLICKIANSRKKLALSVKSRKRRTPAYIEPDQHMSIHIEKQITIENVYILHQF